MRGAAPHAIIFVSFAALWLKAAQPLLVSKLSDEPHVQRADRWRVHHKVPTDCVDPRGDEDFIFFSAMKNTKGSAPMRRSAPHAIVFVSFVALWLKAAQPLLGLEIER
jgi:hypothetical protein